MNDQITLDHPSCHPVTGWFRASGEWEASPDVTIYLTATGRGNGIGIDWDYDVWSVELYDGDKEVATADWDSRGSVVFGADWESGEPKDKSITSLLWMLGVAHAWAMKSAGGWADKHKEPIAE